MLALAVLCIPVLGFASSDSVRWGTVPEWIGACGLLLIAAGIWRLGRNGERTRAGTDVRTRTDA